MYKDEPPFNINSTFDDLLKDSVNFSTVYIYDEHC